MREGSWARVAKRLAPAHPLGPHRYDGPGPALDGRKHVVGPHGERSALFPLVARAVVDAGDAKAFPSWSRGKSLLDASLAAAGARLEPWTLHDLRRSVATGMAELGVPPHIVEAVLNHVSGHKAGIAGVYNRASYEREKRAALAMWADHVLADIQGRDGNVVAMRA